MVQIYTNITKEIFMYLKLKAITFFVVLALSSSLFAGNMHGHKKKASGNHEMMQDMSKHMNSMMKTMEDYNATNDPSRKKMLMDKHMEQMKSHMGMMKEMMGSMQGMMRGKKEMGMMKDMQGMMGKMQKMMGKSKKMCMKNMNKATEDHSNH